MPIYEYRCSDCETKFEILHKSTLNQKDVSCPECNSIKNEKLFSSFSAAFNSSPGDVNSCASGSCEIPDRNLSGGCASGMCGLD